MRGTPHGLPVEERFRRQTDRTGECWLWRGALHDGYPYGTFNAGRGRIVRAHRFAYEMESGPIPKGLYVLHTCDEPRCVRPSHLWLGTQADNMHDRDRKGRARRGMPRREAAWVA